MANRDLARAKFALREVQGVPADKKLREKYKTQLLKLPARLHTNGLGQTVAFYLSSGAGSAEDRICRWFEDWLRGPAVGIYPADRDLIDAITAGTEDSYRRASAEARALASWLKRFAEAFLTEQTTAANAQEPARP